MNPLPEFLEPTSEFEMWREYRDKRNRRAFYYLLLLLILLIIAYALPSTTGPVFGTSDTNTTQPNPGSGEGVPGADGEDGEDGRDGRDGQDGQDGQDGEPGAPGAPGAAGPAGPAGPAGSGGASSPNPSASPGTSVGQGILRVGTCDDAIDISLRSRLVSGVFYFKQITLTNISNACNGKEVDIYLLDGSNSEIASVLDQPISGSSLTIQYSDFSPSNVTASSVEAVALEIRD